MLIKENVVQFSFRTSSRPIGDLAHDLHTDRHTVCKSIRATLLLLHFCFVLLCTGTHCTLISNANVCRRLYLYNCFGRWLASCVHNC